MINIAARNAHAGRMIRRLNRHMRIFENWIVELRAGRRRVRAEFVKALAKTPAIIAVKF